MQPTVTIAIPTTNALSSVHEVSTRGIGAGGIAQVLRNEILEGRLEFGERLPPERSLATHFGASRGTIREALRRLEETQLVNRRVGSGTFVSYQSRSNHVDIAETTSPLELIEVRFAIEPHMVRLAILNARSKDIERLHETLKRVEATNTDPDEFSQADEAFHQALAECTRNPLMVWLYGHINDVRGHNQWNARKDKILTKERIEDYNRQHRALVQAINSRHMEGGVKIIIDHLENARKDLSGSS